MSVPDSGALVSCWVVSKINKIPTVELRREDDATCKENEAGSKNI
jgi:hypothetical protein